MNSGSDFVLGRIQPVTGVHGYDAPIDLRGIDIEQAACEVEGKAAKSCQSSSDKDSDGGYGWVVVFAAFILTFSSYGLSCGFGVFFSSYLKEEKFAGATRLDYAFVGGIAFGVGLAFSPIINYIQGRIGTRATLALGNGLQFTGLLLASFSTKLWQIFLTQGLLQSIGLAFIGLPSLTIVSPWFYKRRVLATLIATAGSGVGGIVFNLGTQSIIDARSTEWALRAEAIITLVLTSIAICLVRTRHEQYNAKFTFFDRDCLKCPAFWVFAFYITTCMFGYVVILYSVADFTRSLGYSSYQGSVASAVVQVGFAIGRPIAGFLSDMYGPTTITAISYYLSALFALAMWIPARNYATIISFAILEGLVVSTIFPTAAPTVARLVGLGKLNVCFCMLWLFLGLAGTFSEAIAAALTSSRSEDPTLYRNTAIFTGCSFVSCACAMMWVRGYIIAKDKIMGTSMAANTFDLLQVKVSNIDIFKSCLAWPSKRA